MCMCMFCIRISQLRDARVVVVQLMSGIIEHVFMQCFAYVISTACLRCPFACCSIKVRDKRSCVVMGVFRISICQLHNGDLLRMLCQRISSDYDNESPTLFVDTHVVQTAWPRWHGQVSSGETTGSCWCLPHVRLAHFYSCPVPANIAPLR